MELQGLATKVIRYGSQFNGVGITDACILQTCEAVKDDLSDLSPVSPSGKHRSPRAARFGGVSRGRQPRGKGRANGLN